MSVTLDGQSLFDDQKLEIERESIIRDSMERTMPGLDGVFSIDMGERNRIIKQKGMLLAKSRLAMNTRISAISAFIDGKPHILVASGGEEVGNLRMDAFKVSKERPSGSGIVVDYEIVYTQLKV